MQCQQCQYENPQGMRFCGQCGEKLPEACPSCGAEVPSGFKFCGQCGASLRADSPERATARAPEVAGTTSEKEAGSPPVDPDVGSETSSEDRASRAEIKNVTVLCGELIIAGQDILDLDTEHMHEVLSRFFTLAEAEAGRYGGTISQRSGRGFLALFGAAKAYEDHARRAVLASLDLRNQVTAQFADLSTDGDATFRVRMGISSGRVVVGGIQEMVVGHATSHARDLVMAASAGETWIASETARVVRAFATLEPVPDETLSGSSIRDVWRLDGLRSDRQTSTPQTVRGPFVGRDRELALLEELRARADQGKGQLVAISGEAGSGKSRLLFELRRSLRGQTVNYLRGRCHSFGAGIPYLPIVEMIRNASRISYAAESPDAEEGRDAESIAAKLEEALRRTGTDAEETLPILLRLLGIERASDGLDRLEPQAIQRRTFAALRRMLLDASRNALVIIELEDLHWIDETSEHFIHSLVEILDAARIMLLVTFRTGYRLRWLDRSFSTLITMHPLSAGESRRLVDTLLDRLVSDEIPDREGRMATLLAKAEGNPLYLEELARSHVGFDDESGDSSIPDTVQGVLMARIDRLPDDQKRLIRVASVLGRSFPLDLLEAVWADPEPIEPLLEALRRQEFLYRGPSEDRPLHYFKHALVQDVAYESLLSNRRRELHQRAAKALEQLHAEGIEDAYGPLTYHYPRAGEPAKAVHYLTRFARRAARDNAHSESRKTLLEALEQAEKLSTADERDRAIVEILLQLADSLLPLARFPETLELCTRHREHVERLDDAELTARYHFWLAHTHSYLGNLEDTRHHAQLSIEAAKTCDNETTMGKTRYVIGRNGFWSGDFAEGIENSLEAVVLLERSGEPWWQGQAYWVAGFNHYVLGQTDQAFDALERANEIGIALDDERLDTSWSQGYFHASLGDWAAGLEKCQAGLERANDPLNLAVAGGFFGYALFEKGDLDNAKVSLADAIERLDGTGMQQILGWFSIFLAEVRLAAGEIDAAREVAVRGLEISQDAGFRLGVALARKARGRIELAAGDLDTATDLLQHALDDFTALAVPFEVAGVLLDRARLFARRGDDSEATRSVTEARESLERLGQDAMIARATAVAAELGIELELGLDDQVVETGENRR